MIGEMNMDFWIHKNGRSPNVQFATSGGATRTGGSAKQHFWLSSEPL